jgi:hypothetical protein
MGKSSIKLYQHASRACKRNLVGPGCGGVGVAKQGLVIPVSYFNGLNSSLDDTSLRVRGLPCVVPGGLSTPNGTFGLAMPMAGLRTI